jgi:hypothetical protein
MQNNKILSYCLNKHEYFDYKVWNKKFSFHNTEHIKNCLKAHEIYSKSKAFKKELKIYNKINKTNITGEEFYDLGKIFWAVHDLGNITADKNEYLSKYTVKNAENRSINIALNLISLREDLMHLLIHLINTTKFDTASNALFFDYIVFVDRLSNTFFCNKQYKQLIGLLVEFIEEFGDDYMFNPYDHFYGFQNRITKSKFNSIAKQDLIAIKGVYKNEPVNAKAWLYDKLLIKF